MFCRSLFGLLLLDIALSVLLRFVSSDYPFDIFKLFFWSIQSLNNRIFIVNILHRSCTACIFFYHKRRHVCESLLIWCEQNNKYWPIIYFNCLYAWAFGKISCITLKFTERSACLIKFVFACTNSVFEKINNKDFSC